MSGLAVGALTFDEFHEPASGLIQAAEGFLCSSAITAVVSAVFATMLLFLFEGWERGARRDLAIAWLPLVLLDISILEFLVGMVCWYSSKNLQWKGELMATQLTALMSLCLALCLWMMFVEDVTYLHDRSTERCAGPPCGCGRDHKMRPVLTDGT